MSGARVTQNNSRLLDAGSAPDRVLQRKCACGQHTPGGAQCRACTDKEKLKPTRQTNSFADSIYQAANLSADVLKTDTAKDDPPSRFLGAAAGAASGIAAAAGAAASAAANAASAAANSAIAAASNVAGSFNANRVAHPSAPAFGEVDWNANDPVASYSAYADGSNWRFRLNSIALDVPVGVASGGRIDVPSGLDSVVTASTWSAIANDLTPAGGTPNRSPRSTYWAEDLTWVHEIFHFNEFNGFLRTSFRTFENTIEGSGYTEAQVAGDTEAAALGRKSADLNSRLLSAWNQAKVSMSPGMEDRAYADGVPHYQTRARDVLARAASEGWA